MWARTPYGVLQVQACSPSSWQGNLWERPSWTAATGKPTTVQLSKKTQSKRPPPNSLRGILGTDSKAGSIDSGSKRSFKTDSCLRRSSSVPAINLDLTSQSETASPGAFRRRSERSPSAPTLEGTSPASLMGAAMESLKMPRPKRRGGDQRPPSGSACIRRSMSALTMDADCNVIDDSLDFQRKARANSVTSQNSGFADMMRASPDASGDSGDVHAVTMPMVGRRWFTTVSQLS